MNTANPSLLQPVGLSLRKHTHRQMKLGGGGVGRGEGRLKPGEVSRVGGGAVGLGGCVKVIKTFHDIRVCEVPRADH